MRTLYFDCFSGASGDMIVGALLDAGADFGRLKQAVGSLDVSGYALSAEKVVKNGITATQFTVKPDPDQKQPHRHLRHVVEIIDSGALSESVKAASIKTFQRIAEAEAHVHGTTIEKVHFHEVGAIDSIVDVVGAHVALEDLGIEQIAASVLPVGSGTVKCDHGPMPVPAPATVLLLQGVPACGGHVEGELVTPTGAALVSQLAGAYGPMPAMSIGAIGYGAGTRSYPDRANVLRAIVGETTDVPAADEIVVLIETNLDDMAPELLAPLVDELLAAGARDAFLTPIVGKKGRPGFVVAALCDESDASDIAATLIRNSSTLGVRMRTERRICLERTWKTASTPWGEVRIKLGRFEGKITVVSPEYEDCRRLSREAGVSVKDVYVAAQSAAAAIKEDLNHV